jgi:spore germination cell wall hydrolase CwlJ-like protein
MKILTLTGVVLSTITLIGMSAVGVEAYNYEQEQIRLADVSRQRECLALNIYHEAKGESELGQRAVAYVTLNRANDPAYPDDICDVVYQGAKKNGVPVRNKCQFSWYCDGKDDEPTDDRSYSEALYVASVVINTYGMSFDPTMGATMYHADYVNPGWSDSFEKTTEIENHIFYRKE